MAMRPPVASARGLALHGRQAIRREARTAGGQRLRARLLIFKVREQSSPAREPARATGGRGARRCPARAWRRAGATLGDRADPRASAASGSASFRWSASRARRPRFVAQVDSRAELGRRARADGAGPRGGRPRAVRLGPCAGAVGGARDAGSAIEVVEALRGVLWEALLEELRAALVGAGGGRAGRSPGLYLRDGPRHGPRRDGGQRSRRVPPGRIRAPMPGELGALGSAAPGSTAAARAPLPVAAGRRR